MSNLQTVLAVLGTLVVLTSVGGGLYAYFRSTAADARIKRLQDERDDYLSRLNYIEPRHKVIEQQNELLRQLHNPTALLETIAGKADEIIVTLDEQRELLEEIDGKLHEPRKEPS